MTKVAHIPNFEEDALNVNAITPELCPDVFGAFAAIRNLRRKVLLSRNPVALANWLQTKLRRAGFPCEMFYDENPPDKEKPKMILIRKPGDQPVAEGTPKNWRHFVRRNDFDSQNHRREKTKKPGRRVEASRRRPLMALRVVA